MRTAELGQAVRICRLRLARTKPTYKGRRMFWIGAAVSLCYIPGVTGAYIATQWPVLAVLLSFGLLRSGPFTVFHALGLAFVAYAFALWPHSSAPYASVFGLWLVVIMGLCVWFGTTVMNVRGLYAGLAAGGAVSSAIAVFQWFGWDGVLTVSAQPAGIYANGIQQGAVLALVIVALASERMWTWVLPLVPGVVLAQSRGAWVALAVGLIGCGVRRLWVFGVVAVAGAFYLSFVLSDSDMLRMYIWRTAWENLTWLGWGPGVFYTIVLPWKGAFSLYPEYAHNDVLQLVFEYGIGAMFVFFVLGYALWRTDAKEWPIVLAFVAAGCYSMPLFMPIAAFLALVAVGRILRLHGLAVRNSDYCGQLVVSRQWHYARAGQQTVSVASCYPAKG